MPASSHADLDGLRADYLAALLARDSHHARVLVERALARGADPAALDLHVLAPTLRELGDRWERGELTVAEEHFATGITEGVMAMVAERMRRPPLGGRLAVVACPPGERHGVPARMLGDFLESAGWEVLVVGSDVPVRDLLELVEDEQPDVVCVSVTMSQTIDAAFEVLGALGTADPRPLLAIGGQAWDGTARIAGAVGADLVASDPVELLRILQERLPPLPEEDPEA